MSFEKQILKVGNIKEIVIGLSWDMFDKNAAVDLDASCVFFDGFGRIKDAVFYNQLKTSFAVHSGDNKTGEGEGFDETIRVDLNKMAIQEIGSFIVVINAYTGGNFSNVETAQATIVDPTTNQTITELSVGCSGNHTALIFCCVYQAEDGSGWAIRELSRTANGKDFQKVEKEMKEELRFLIPEELENEMVWDHTKKKTFNMKKGECVRLRGLNSVKMGLGWDSRCDLDASVVEVDFGMNVPSIVMFSRKFNENRSIRHSGDNTTGEGSGDDEVIEIDLDNVDRSVAFLVCLVNVYTGSSGFGDVRGAYCRLVSSKGQVVCRYNLSNQKSGKAMMMSLIYRVSVTEWKIKALGEKAGNGSTATASKDEVVNFLKDLPECVNVLNGPIAKEMVMENVRKLERKLEVNEEKRVEAEKLLEELVTDLEETPESTLVEGRIKMRCRAEKVDKMDLFGKSDPFYVVKRHGVELYKSGVKMKTLDPEWDSHKIDGIQDLFQPLEVEVFDWDKNSSNDLIGTFEFIPNEVKEGKNNYEIINEKKKKKKKKYKNSGTFVFVRFSDEVYKKNREYKRIKDKMDSSRIKEAKLRRASDALRLELKRAMKNV